MEWTVNYFHTQSLKWKVHYDAVDNNIGRKCIAAKECAVWEKMKEDAEQMTQRFKIAHSTTATRTLFT
jgi:hypothetical protein